MAPWAPRLMLMSGSLGRPRGNPAQVWLLNGTASALAAAPVTAAAQQRGCPSFPCASRRCPATQASWSGMQSSPPPIQVELLMASVVPVKVSLPRWRRRPSRPGELSERHRQRSPKSWPGKRSTWRELSVAMSDDRRPQRRSFDSSTGPKYERNLQNRLQNREGETG
jgi:hypothetical protein